MPEVITINLPVKPSLLPFCRKLIDGGENPDAMVHVYRGDTLCFHPAPLKDFAELAVQEGDKVSARFAKYKPFPKEVYDGAAQG